MRTERESGSELSCSCWQRSCSYYWAVEGSTRTRVEDGQRAAIVIVRGLFLKS